MGYIFPGVKRDDDGAYYYDHDDIPKITVPISKTFEGNVNITMEKLDEYFELSKDLPRVPKYLVRPRLDSTWNYSKNNGWDITGQMIVYQPIEWVPIIISERTYPKGKLTTEFEKEETSIEENKLFGKISSELEISGGGGFYGVKIEVKVKAEGSVEATLENKTVRKIITRGTLGDVVVKEVWLAMSLKMKQVYSRKIALWNDNNGGKHDVSWSGGPGWDAIHVASRELRRVEGLQFSKVIMSGSGASNNLFFQVLPEISGGELKDLHIAISNSRWIDWYAYVPPNSIGKEVSSEEILPWRSYKPIATLMAF